MEQKILLIAGFPPEGGGGGGVNLRSLIDNISSNNLYWYSLQHDKTNKTWYRPNLKRGSIFFRLPGRRYKLIDILYIKIYHKFELFINLILVQFIILKFKPTCLWIIIDQYSIPALFCIVKLTKLPWHITVQDDPEVSLNLSGHVISRKNLEKFEFLYKNAESRDCTSFGMVNYYKQKYSVDSFMVSRSIDLDKSESNRKRSILSGDTIKILLGGWGNCPPPWPENLLTALGIIESKTNKSVKLYSFDPLLVRYNSRHVVLCQKMPQDQFEKLLNQMDLGYAPDPFDEKFEVFVKTSLSVKMITYISATLPCLYHGPVDSSIGEMFNRYQAGEIVNSNDPNELANGFLKLINNSDFYRDNSLFLAKSDFNPEIMRQKILNRFN
jgi:glycosyltransferase involved in cell wall biosynthesis